MQPFHESIGIAPIASTGQDVSGTMELVVDEHHLNTFGGLHGGVIATILDSAMGRAVRAGLDEGQFPVTVQMTITYLAKAQRGDLLQARPEIRRRGATLVLVEADLVRPADGEEIAHAIATFTVGTSR